MSAQLTVEWEGLPLPTQLTTVESRHTRVHHTRFLTYADTQKYSKNKNFTYAHKNPHTRSGNPHIRASDPHTRSAVRVFYLFVTSRRHTLARILPPAPSWMLTSLGYLLSVCGIRSFFPVTLWLLVSLTPKVGTLGPPNSIFPIGYVVQHTRFPHTR